MADRQSSLKNIITRNFPGINLLQISIVEDENAEQYKSRFFGFLKGVPGEKSESSPTGKTYNYSNGINLKIEAEKIFALANALRICAEGKFEPYEKNFGHFEIFADSSKSGYGEGTKKSVRVGVMKNNKTGKFVITVSFMAGNNKSTSFMSPYEAVGFAKTLDFCGEKVLELEAQKNTGFAVNQQSSGHVNPIKETPTPTNPEPTADNDAVGSFKSMFPNNMEGMDDMPF